MRSPTEARGPVPVAAILTGLFVFGLALLLAVLLLRHDLRGWTPDRFDDAATKVLATSSKRPAFTIGQCLPGTIRPWNEPTAAEYQGSATVAVLTCRSRFSFIAMVLAYLAAAGVVLILGKRLRRRVPVRRRR